MKAFLITIETSTGFEYYPITTNGGDFQALHIMDALVLKLIANEPDKYSGCTSRIDKLCSA